MQTSTLFDAKTADFLKFKVCLHKQRRGLSQYRHFANKGSQFFAIL